MKYLSDWLRCTCILIASACFSLMMKTVKVKRRMSGLHRLNHSQGKILQVMIQLTASFVMLSIDNKMYLMKGIS